MSKVIPPFEAGFLGHWNSVVLEHVYFYSFHAFEVKPGRREHKSKNTCKDLQSKCAIEHSPDEEYYSRYPKEKDQPSNSTVKLIVKASLLEHLRFPFEA